MVNIWIRSSRVYSQRRLDDNLPLSVIKEHLELITGIPAIAQSVQVVRATIDPTKHVLSPNDELLPNDSLSLSSYKVRDGSTLIISHKDPNGNFDTNASFDDWDSEHVQKFVLADDAYSNKKGTVRDYLKQNHIGPYGDQPVRPKEEPSLSIGLQCSLKDSRDRTGVIRYLGEAHFGSGSWVGIEWDAPFGIGDGSVEGKRYFSTKPRHASFVRPSRVLVLHDEEPDEL